MNTSFWDHVAGFFQTLLGDLPRSVATTAVTGLVIALLRKTWPLLKKFGTIRHALVVLAGSVLIGMWVHQWERLRSKAQSARPIDAKNVENKEVVVSTEAMMLIPSGEFTMGSYYSRDEWGPHRVWLDPFYIDRAEVTNREYGKFLAWILKTVDHRRCHPDEPKNKDHTPKYWTDPRLNSGVLPVVGVDWFDACAYAAWAGKRLPSEAEWEKAARGGLDGNAYPWGDGPPHGRANFYGADSGGALPPGSFPPNGYGLVDMAGNVWEWCSDWYGKDHYASPAPSNPTGPPAGLYRVVRGGSWSDSLDQDLLRCGDRSWRDPLTQTDNLGFRCAKTP